MEQNPDLSLIGNFVISKWQFYSIYRNYGLLTEIYFHSQYHSVEEYKFYLNLFKNHGYYKLYREQEITKAYNYLTKKHEQIRY